MAQPTNFSVNPNKYSEDGWVQVLWEGTPSANHYAYRVYRLGPEDKVWQLIRQRTDAAANYTYDDYFAPAGDVFYAVVEVTQDVNGVQTEETRSPKLVRLSTPYYWILHPTNNQLHVKLRNVTSDDFSNERQYEIKNLIGRGRKIDIGDDWGKKGSIEGSIYDSADKSARKARLDIEAAKDLDSHWFLRNPFGDVWKIWWTDPEFSRVSGVGKSEFVTMTFEYYEVA